MEILTAVLKFFLLLWGIITIHRCEAVGSHWERCATWCKHCEQKWARGENCAPHRIGGEDGHEGTGEKCDEYPCHRDY